MKHPIAQLPKWMKILIRICLLPFAMFLHLIPHIIGFVLSMKNWVLYGGEFISYEKNDAKTIREIYDKLNQTT